MDIEEVVETTVISDGSGTSTTDITDIFDAATILAEREDGRVLMVSGEYSRQEEVSGLSGDHVDIPGIAEGQEVMPKVTVVSDYMSEVLLDDHPDVVLASSSEELIVGDHEGPHGGDHEGPLGVDSIVMMDSEDVLLGDTDVIGQQEVILGEEDEISDLSVPLDNSRNDVAQELGGDEDEEEGRLIYSDYSGETDTKANSGGSETETTGQPAAEVPPKPSKRKSSSSAKKSGRRPSRNKRKKGAYSPGGGGGVSKLFLCPYCNISGYNLEMIHVHIMKSHPQCGKYKCTECTYASDYEVGLEIHRVVHESSPPFQCSVCSFQSNMDFQLNKHINLHTGEKQFKCSQCDYGTDHTTNYRRHMERHTRLTGTPCPHCSYSCVNVYQLNKHIDRSHKDKLPASTTRDTDITGIKQEPKPSKFEIPDMEFKREVMDPEHGGGESVVEQSVEEVDCLIKCNQCSFTTKYSSTLAKHMILHSGGSTEQISCELCSYTTVIRSNLRRHYRSAHPDLSSYDSPSASTAPSVHKSHSSHRKESSPQQVSRSPLVKRDKEGLMKCDYCDYKTAWNTNLKRHYLTHEPKVCNSCSFSTMDRAAFAKHMKSHETGDDSDSDAETNSVSSNQQQEDLTCNICGYTAAVRKLLRQHCAAAHGAVTDAAAAKSKERRLSSRRGDEEPMEGSDMDDTLHEQKQNSRRPSSRSSNVSSRNSLTAAAHSKVQDKFHCLQCDFSCNHDTWLETHMKQHAIGKTAHKCQYCGYTAPNPHRLKAHMMTHTGYKPYKCPRCDFASSNSSNLYRHIRKKHNPEDVELAKNQKIEQPPESSDEEEVDVDEEPTEEDLPSPDSEEEKTRGDSLAQSRGRIPLVIFRCKVCEFSTMSRDSLSSHKELHAIADLVEDVDLDGSENDNGE